MTENFIDSIIKAETKTRSELGVYRKILPDLTLQRLAEGYEDLRRDINEYGAAREEIGEARGETKRTIKHLIRLLEYNIAPPSEALCSRIGQMSDLDQLENLYERVMQRQVSTLEEFESHLPK